MAKKRTPEAPEPEPELRLAPTDAAAKIDDRIAKGSGLLDQARAMHSASQIEELRSNYYKWDAYNEELLGRLFTTRKLADEYSMVGRSPVMVLGPQSLAAQMKDLLEDISSKIRGLESIKERLELYPLAAGVSAITPARTPTPRPHTNRAFIVHGHDEAVRETVARYLERLGVEPIILHEQATGGRTIVEKLERYSDVDFTVVLLTADDVGAAKREQDNLRPRARQNVMLELGYFAGKLGRNKVCALYQAGVEMPSDYLGVGYVQLDAGGGWRLELAKELRAAGFAIDMNLVV
jgi:predicted nucleotide-binding protein